MVRLQGGTDHVRCNWINSSLAAMIHLNMDES